MKKSGSAIALIGVAAVVVAVVGITLVGRQDSGRHTSEPPGWLSEDGSRYLGVYVGPARADRVTYVLGIRESRVVYELGRSVECVGCSHPRDARAVRGRTIEFAFDAKTQRLTEAEIKP